jgi:hypothetical protein
MTREHVLPCDLVTLLAQKRAAMCERKTCHSSTVRGCNGFTLFDVENCVAASRRDKVARQQCATV